jgi:Cu(I)/Ag(I) efflux system protein CusF
MSLHWPTLIRPLLATGLAVACSWAAAQSTLGEVRKIDKAQAKLTLQHEAIASLNMPAMTMAYRVQNPAWLESLKVGDKVRFDADKVGGQYTITALKPAP